MTYAFEWLLSERQPERQSEAIRGNQRQSEAIRDHQRQSEVIRCNPRGNPAGDLSSSEVIRDHQRSSEVISGTRPHLDCREPSTSKSLSHGRPVALTSASMLVRTSPSASGLNVLKSGEIIVG